MPARKPKPKPARKPKAALVPTAEPTPDKRPGTAYEPTAKDIRTVASMATWNLSHDEIAKALGITAKTLRKHFKDDLAKGFLLAQDRMWRSLFSQGLGSPARKADKAKGIPGSPAIPPNVQATIKWLEFRAGASARVTVIDGGAEADLKTMSDTEVADRLAKVSRSPAVLRAAKATTVH